MGVPMKSYIGLYPSIQIKTGTSRQETALMVALKIHINTSIKHQTVNKAYNIGVRKTQTAKIR